jgi:hypothetical protein
MRDFRPLSRDEAPAEARPAFDRNLEIYGQVLNSTGVYAYRPTIQAGRQALAQAIDASGLLPARLRYLVMERVASLVGCPL